MTLEPPEPVIVATLIGFVSIASIGHLIGTIVLIRRKMIWHALVSSALFYFTVAWLRWLVTIYVIIVYGV